MNMRRILITALGCLVLGIPSVSHAATFTGQAVQGGGAGVTWQWVPTPQHASPGETIDWTWANQAHNVTKYSGDGAAFASPTSTGAGGSYSRVFSGGQIWFRCTVHSTLSNGGACQGMCGSYTDRTVAPNTPSFFSPNQGATVSSTFTVSGFSEPWMLVIITQNGVPRGRAQSNGSGAWSVSVTPAPGAAKLTAVSYDAENRASSATTLDLTVLADTVNPTVAITEPVNDQVIVATTYGGHPVFRGMASDDSGIVSVQVNVYAAGLLQVIGPGYNFAVCSSCPSGPDATVSWSFNPIGFVPGNYTVVATAKDRVGHITNSAAVNFTYLGPL